MKEVRQSPGIDREIQHICDGLRPAVLLEFPAVWKRRQERRPDAELPDMQDNHLRWLRVRGEYACNGAVKVAVTAVEVDQDTLYKEELQQFRDVLWVAGYHQHPNVAITGAIELEVPGAGEVVMTTEEALALAEVIRQKTALPAPPTFTREPDGKVPS